MFFSMFFVGHGRAIVNMGIRLVEGEVLAWQLRKEEISKTITTLFLRGSCGLIVRVGVVT